MLKGKILWMRKRDGFGIIKSDDNKEYYFDISTCKQIFNDLQNDDNVLFELNDRIKDCRCAKNLTKVA